MLFDYWESSINLTMLYSIVKDQVYRFILGPQKLSNRDTLLVCERPNESENVTKYFVERIYLHPIYMCVCVMQI